MAKTYHNGLIVASKKFEAVKTATGQRSCDQCVFTNGTKACGERACVSGSFPEGHALRALNTLSIHWIAKDSQ